MSNIIRWGILGTGSIASIFAAALRSARRSQLVAVGSRSQARADQFAARFSVARAYGSYDELVADQHVDAVYIALPNHLHCTWTIRCAEHGKHILCEKPLATNYGEAMTMVEVARRHQVFLVEAFMYRCHPQTARLVQLVRDGAIGTVRTIDLRFSFNMGQQPDNIRLRNEAAGGAIMDVGCYCVSMARLLAGAAAGEDFAEPDVIKGLAHIGSGSRVDEWATALLRFPGDILANLTCGTQVQIDQDLHIWGSAGHLHVPNPWFPGRDGSDGTIILRRTGQAAAEEIVVPSDAPLYVLEADLVAHHLADGLVQSPWMRWADSLGNMRALDRWRRDVGLVFEREQANALTVPFSGRAPGPRPDHTMRYGRVDGVDKPVSRIVLGSMVMHIDQLPYSFALLDFFVEQGGTCIDTAWAYGGNASEKALGAWFHQRNNRESIVLVGKGAASIRCTPEMVTTQLHESLERLQTDYVDIYLMHRDNPHVPVGEFVECLNEHYRAGRIRAFGGSNWTPQRIGEANAYAAAHGLKGFAASSPNLSLAVWNEPAWSDCLSASDKATREWYARSGIPVFAWSSQAGGFFAGDYGPADRHDPALANMARVWFNADNFRRLERARELGASKGATANQIALAYVLCQPLTIFALIGPQTIEEMRTSLEALEIELTPAELRWLNLEE